VTKHDLKGSWIKMRPHAVRGEMVPQAMLMPSQQLLEDTLRDLPAGVAADLGALRSRMTALAGAEACCPVTTQRGLLAIAEDQVTRYAEGAPRGDLVPFWRVIDPGRPLARRVAGGADFVRARLAEENKD
jgi:hypothetical protein